MLDNLATIDWANLSHAYGPAADVPDQIRALASADQDARRAAMDALYGNIWHQGTVYEATAYAVPFLIELAQLPAVADRDAILVLLCHLANGHSYLDVHQHLPIFKEVCIDRMDPTVFEAELEHELAGVDSARAAVRQGIPIYTQLLHDPDPGVRVAAAYLLAAFAGDDPTIARHLYTQLTRETHTTAQAGLILALGVSTAPDAAFQELLETYIEPEAEPLVRLVAAMALARLCGSQTPPAAVDVLIGMLAPPQTVAAAYRQLPWAENDVVGDVSATLRYLSWEQAQAALPILLNTFQALEMESRKQQLSVAALKMVELAGTLLHLAFHGRPLGHPATAEALTTDQHRVLTAIAGSDGMWLFIINAQYVMEAFALPTERERLQRFLDGEGIAADEEFVPALRRRRQ